MIEINQHGDHAATCFCCTSLEFNLAECYDNEDDCVGDLARYTCFKRHFNLEGSELTTMQHELVRRGMGCSDFKPVDIKPSFDVVQREYSINNSREVRKYNKEHRDEACIMEWSAQRAFNLVVLEEGVALAKEYCEDLGVSDYLVMVYCYGTRYRVSVTPGHQAGPGRWDRKDGSWERVEGVWKPAVGDFTGFLGKDPGMR